MMFSYLDTAPHPRRYWFVKILKPLINHAKGRVPGEC
jgi:hypothetical protein